MGSVKSADGQFGVNSLKPESPWVRLVRHVGKHDIACQSPDDGNDGIDYKEPS
jgi:hypothetical protein